MRTVRLGILGFGTVVQGFLELLPEKREFILARFHQDIRVAGVCDSTEYLTAPDGIDPERLLGMKLEKVASGEPMGGVLDYDARSLVAAYMDAGVNVVVEALPPNRKSGEPALSYVLSFLNRRVPVVTADKSPLVFGFQPIMAAARQSGVPIKYSAATAAALPTLDTVSVSLAGSELYGFEGILNGTTNFLLTEMIHNKTSIDEETDVAIEMKICEPDPSFDVDGWDTAFKTLILARTFLDPKAELSDVQIQGVRGLTYSDVEPVLRGGNTLKLLGKVSFDDDQLRMRVKPSIIGPDHPFFHVNNTAKGVTFYTDTLGRLTLLSGSSGPKETAATILKDILNVHRGVSL